MTKASKWTAAEDAVIEARYPDASAATLAVSLDRSVAAVYRRASTLGVRKSAAFFASDASGRLKRGASNNPANRRWTQAEDDYLLNHYAHTGTGALARKLGRSINAVYDRSHMVGLKKSPAWLASDASGRDNLKRLGKDTRFKPGHTTWNKGKKGLQLGGEATYFKAGNLPHNTAPIGKISRDAKDGYLKRKISHPNVWEWMHVATWEAANGDVPPGHAITFKDGDVENVNIDNLECVSRAELMARNTIHRYPPQLKRVIRLAAKLDRTINSRKEPDHEKHH